MGKTSKEIHINQALVMTSGYDVIEASKKEFFEDCRPWIQYATTAELFDDGTLVINVITGDFVKLAPAPKIGDFLMRAIGRCGVEKIREIVYGHSVHCEVEGMRRFIDSRQGWCKRKILANLASSEKEG